MRNIFKLLVCAMVLAMATQARASFVLDFSGFTGGSVVDGGQALNSLTFSGTSSIAQNLGSDAALTVGDTFTQAPLQDYSTGYTNTSNVFTVSLGGNGQMLTIVAPQFTGELTSNPLPNSFVYNYDIPTSGIQIYYSNTAGTSSTLISTATLIAPSGGLNSDTLGGGFFTTGTFHLYADLNSLTSGIFKTSDGTDFATYLAAGNVVLANLDGHINLNTETLNTTNPNNIVVNSDFNDDGQFTLTATPEPGTMLLMGVGTLGLAFLRRRVC